MWASAGSVVVCAVSYKILSTLTWPLTGPFSTRIVSRHAGDEQHVKVTYALIGLFAHYLFGGIVFSITGGSLGQLIFVTDKSDYTSGQILLAHSLGLLFVAAVRIESVTLGLSLLNTYLQLCVILGATIFLYSMTNSKLAENLVTYSKMMTHEVQVQMVLSSILTLSIIELLIYVRFGINSYGKKLVPFDLVRQRIDGPEMVEQIWHPSSVTDKTAEAVNDYFFRLGSMEELDLQWLTWTCPRKVVDALMEGLKLSHDRFVVHNHMDESKFRFMLRERLKVIVPQEAEQTFLNVSRGTYLEGCIRFLGSEAAPRRRFLVVGYDRAILHIPFSFDSDPEKERFNSSNHAIILSDPTRIADMRSWFNELWEKGGRLRGP